MNRISTLIITASLLASSTLIAKDLIIKKAVASISPKSGYNTSGTVVFTKVKNGINIEVNMRNLSSGSHGFHIHKYGDSRLNNGKSAGGHFNPDGQKHGAHGSNYHHAGDLKNIVADKNGNAHLQYVTKSIFLNGPKNIIGRSVIVHINSDDHSTQPTGGAGIRIGQGIIGIAK